MTTIRRELPHRIWIPGRPQSFQGGRRDRYKESIRDAARQVFSTPLTSRRIDVEIYFVADRSLRADVDNVLKPILDALKGVVYEDDRQVRSVRVVALPRDDCYGGESVSLEVLDGPMETHFLVNIHEGVYLSGPLL